MNTTQALAWLGGISPFAAIGGGYLVNRRIQRANAAKTLAEARLAESNANKTDTDIQSTIIANTRTLLAEARTVQAEKDAIKDERIGSLVGRVKRMEDRFDAMRTALATHGVWDAAALIDLRQEKPDYPGPPPWPADHYDGV